MKWLFVIFGLLIQQQLKCQELFSSTDSLWDLARNFETIVKALDDFSDDVESEYVRRKVDEFKSENVAIKKNLKEYITNPLNAFKLIKLTYYDIEKIRKDFPEEFSWYYESIEDLIPTSNDLLGAVTGILRLQQIYRFRSEDFANGIIGDKKVRDLLTTNDIYVIGTFARQLDFKSIYFAKKYLNLTLERVEKNDYEKTEIEMMSLQLDLAKICNRTSDFEEVTRLATNILKNHPNSVIASKLKNDSDHLRSIGYKPKKLPRNPYSDFYVRNQQYSQKKETILYSRVCRGDLKQSADVLAKLKCRFDSDSPYKKLVRSKIEEFNLDPYVVLFHDVISDSEVEVLKKIGRPGKHRGQVESEKEGVSGEVSGARVSHVSWLKDDAHQTVAKINQRISELTGLSMELAEELQLQNYGIGGHYSPHFDHWTKEDKADYGVGINRIATFLIYMDEVKTGGYTAFPYLKLRIPVVKHGAAFWYNLNRSGVGESRTCHAGCPVIIGEKWVANKWISFADQMFKRPCLPEKFIEEDMESYYKAFF